MDSLNQAATIWISMAVVSSHGHDLRGVASLNGADTAEKKLTIAMEFGLGVAAARQRSASADRASQGVPPEASSSIP